jgi:nucleoid-associated protein YgaU
VGELPEGRGGAPDEGGPQASVEENPGPATHVLWGRVAALALVLATAFLLGRLSVDSREAGGELERLQSALEEERAANDELRAELAEAPAESPSPSPTTEQGSPDEGRTYVVKPGDTLRGIAARFYGDVGLADLIAETNGIRNAAQLPVGQELVIPPEP